MKESFPPQPFKDQGTASYVSLKTALLLKDSKDGFGIDRAKAPFFYDFAYVDGYIDNITRKGAEIVPRLPIRYGEMIFMKRP